jgi:hypothetical protein
LFAISLQRLKNRTGLGIPNGLRRISILAMLCDAIFAEEDPLIKVPGRPPGLLTIRQENSNVVNGGGSSSGK